MWNCKFQTPKAFDPPHVLEKLYGKQFDLKMWPRGKGSMFVLGQHNSGTSMLARVIMLMGGFHGNLNGLSTSPTNRLKYWEKLDVSHFHDMLLSKVSDPRFRPYHAQSVDLSLMSGDMKRRLQCFIRKIVADLNRHKPWVLKDPRMLLFAQHWIDAVPDGVCVIVYREPLANAISLAENGKKSDKVAGKEAMTVEHWLDAWEQGMLSALYACQGTPSVIVQLEEMQTDLMRFMYKLYAQLAQAGVTGLQMPSTQAVAEEFGSYLKAQHRRSESRQLHSLSRTQAALSEALQIVASTPDGGLDSHALRADVVLQLYRDIGHASWAG